MRQINLVEGKVVAPEGMKVGIVAARFNEIIVNKLLGILIVGAGGQIGSELTTYLRKIYASSRLIYW